MNAADIAALDQLARADGFTPRYVLCRKTDKGAGKGWNNARPSLAVVQQAIADDTDLVGIVPGSIGCTVVDVDRGGDAALAEVKRILGNPWVSLPSRQADGWHCWYRTTGEARNREWQYGDVRGSHGYAVLWQPGELVARWPARQEASSLPGADVQPVRNGGKLPDKPNQRRRATGSRGGARGRGQDRQRDAEPRGIRRGLPHGCGIVRPAQKGNTSMPTCHAPATAAQVLRARGAQPSPARQQQGVEAAKAYGDLTAEHLTQVVAAAQR